jgi:hypothetical protein
MPRTSRHLTATVQLSKVRIKEELRRRLKRAAEQHHVTLNGEIVGRLEQTFEQTILLDLNQIFENAKRYMYPLIEGGGDLKRENELIGAAKGLIGRIEPLLAARVIAGPEAEAMRRAIEQVYLAIKAIDNEAVQRARRVGATS